MIRKIIRFPAPSLRPACEPVTFPLSDALAEHLRDLRDTLAATPHGVALASNQVLAEGVRAFVVRAGLRSPAVASMSPESRDGTQPFPEVVINPSWRPYPPREIDWGPGVEAAALADAGYVEGCLSVPELSLTLPERQYWAELEYQDEEGKTFVHVCRGLGARIVQHECDHLDGRLIWDLADRKTQARVRAEAIKNKKRGR